MNKWLISSQKNKSNVRGIKINDISRLIGLAFFEKGNAYDQKMDNTKRAFFARHILLKMKGRYVNKRGFRRVQKRVLLNLKAKHDVPISSKDENLIGSLPTIFNDLFRFLKYKRKYKKVKIISKTVRSLLLGIWFGKNELEQRWKHVWNWVTYLSKHGKKYKVKINQKKLDLLKPKYQLVWKDIVRRTG